MKNFTTTAMLFAVCTGALGQTAQLRVTAPGTAQKITRWINTGWLAHESLLKKSLSVSAGGDNTASLASITGIASFGYSPPTTS